MATENEILEIVKILNGVYGKEPGDMRGFYWALADASHDILQEAAQKWVRREKWMPSPAELRQACEPEQSRRHEFWGMQSLLGDLLAGRIKDGRAEKAVSEYFRFDGRRD